MVALIEKEVLQVGNLLQNRGTTQDFQKKHCVKKPFGEAKVRQSKSKYQGCEMFRLKWFHGFIMVSSTSTRSYCHPKPGGMLFWTQNSLKESLQPKLDLVALQLHIVQPRPWCFVRSLGFGHEFFRRSPDSYC